MRKKLTGSVSQFYTKNSKQQQTETTFVLFRRKRNKVMIMHFIEDDNRRNTNIKFLFFKTPLYIQLSRFHTGENAGENIVRGNSICSCKVKNRITQTVKLLLFS